jgi:hypothetical protein
VEHLCGQGHIDDSRTADGCIGAITGAAKRRPEQRGLVEIRIGSPFDTFGVVSKAQRVFLAHKPKYRMDNTARAGLFGLVRSVIHMHPKQALLWKYVPRWLQFSRAIKCADVKMRFRR